MLVRTLLPDDGGVVARDKSRRGPRADEASRDDEDVISSLTNGPASPRPASPAAQSVRPFGGKTGASCAACAQPVPRLCRRGENRVGGVPAHRQRTGGVRRQGEQVVEEQQLAVRGSVQSEFHRAVIITSSRRPFCQVSRQNASARGSKDLPPLPRDLVTDDGGAQ